MKNKRNFKNFFIYKTFQKKIIFFILMSNIASIAIFYGAITHFFYRFITKGQELGIPKNHIFYRFINQLSNEMDIIFGVMAVIILISVITASYIISHKMAGPFYRLKKELKYMAESKTINKIKFRKNDDVVEIEKYFNQVVENVNSNS